MAKKEDSIEGLSLKDLIAALKAASGNDDDAMKRRAEYEAEAHKRLNKRENEQHPGISVYSYPEGDLAHPKPNLKAKMFWVGYDLTTDTLTPEEVRLLNLAKPGEFQFHKTDGSLSTLAVTGSAKADGSLERMEFHFPCRGDNRHNLPSKTAMLREIYEPQSDPSAPLRREIDELKALLATATEPVHA